MEDNSIFGSIKIETIIHGNIRAKVLIYCLKKKNGCEIIIYGKRFGITT